MDKRDAILEAALKLFAERGFYGTPVPLIAHQAGVGAGTIYRYFENKEALVNALYQKWKTELLNASLADFPQGLTMRENFHEGWQRQLEFVRNHPLEMTFLELHHHAAYLDETSRDINRCVSEPFLAIYEQARQEQIFKDLPAELLLAVTQGILMGMMKAYWQGQIDLTPELIEKTEEVSWQALCR
jgi:TetR/AcrR family transcriptional regulator, repressor of fatR-cypB operon